MFASTTGRAPLGSALFLGLLAGAGQLQPTAAFPQRIRGGPDWIRKERYTIEAKAEISTGLPGAQAPERKILMGPMLRTLLEERFQLKLHREIQEDVPMYALVVARSAPTADARRRFLARDPGWTRRSPSSALEGSRSAATASWAGSWARIRRSSSTATPWIAWRWP